MLHNDETTLLQQEVHLERNTQRSLCSTVLNDGTLVSNSLGYTVIFKVAKK